MKPDFEIDERRIPILHGLWRSNCRFDKLWDGTGCRALG
jgi:hypothetical protein